MNLLSRMTGRLHTLFACCADIYAYRARRAPADDAFGLLADRQVDGLEYQRRLNQEWEQ